MRVLLVLLMISTGSAFTAGAARAQGSPYCLKGCDFGTSDCSFTSYQQCQATVSGRTGWCDANPDFHAVNTLQPGSHARMSRRRL